MTICVFGYVAGYLGLTRVLILLARQATPVGMLATFLCNLILISGGVLFPLLIQALINWGNFDDFDYTPLQLPNWIWTLGETIDGPAGGLPAYAWIIIGVAGFVLFLVNLVLTAREVEHVFTGMNMPGVSTMCLHMYLATYDRSDLIAAGGGVAEEEEQIEVVEMPLAELARPIDQGAVVDLATAALVQTLRVRRPDLFAG